MPTRRLTDHRNRGSQIKRTIKIIIKLSTRSYNAIQLSRLFLVSTKTIKRDIRVIEELNIPVWAEMRDNDDIESEFEHAQALFYRIDARWMKPFI